MNKRGFNQALRRIEQSEDLREEMGEKGASYVESNYNWSLIMGRLKKMGKDKIAFVVVRYGADINGGAEYHCRMLAERLVDDYDVEVLTTCVKDYMKGGNDIAEGAEYINRVMVRRFKVDPIRDMSETEYLKRAKPVRRLS